MDELPANVAQILDELMEALLECARPQVEAVILFGSAAEGRLRPTSDVNLLVIADGLTSAQLDAIRTPLRTGRSAVALAVMFLESSELPNAMEAFAVKFADIKARHRVLYLRGDRAGVSWRSASGTGPALDSRESPLEAIEIPREAAVRRLKQVLLNLTLRLRERYAMEGDHEESLSRTLADVTGPLRASAATLLFLGDARHRPPKAALEEFGAGGGWDDCLAGLSAVHRGDRLAPGQVRVLFQDVLRLLAALNAAAHAIG